ncbi:hypothetical protein ABZ806_44245 [Spirillospora sp. NPDC047418]
MLTTTALNIWVEPKAFSWREGRRYQHQPLTDIQETAELSSATTKQRNDDADLTKSPADTGLTYPGDAVVPPVRPVLGPHHPPLKDETPCTPQPTATRTCCKASNASAHSPNEPTATPSTMSSRNRPPPTTSTTTPSTSSAAPKTCSSAPPGY